MSAWKPLSQSKYDSVWDNFYEMFDFKPSVNPHQFPSIKEPVDSVTYLFEYPSAKNQDRFINDVNVKSLNAFQTLVSPNEAIYALDWQHDCYWFYPHLSFSDWHIPIFPDGDYSIFLAKDFSFGIFAHPWEQTFCIWGKALLAEFQRNKPFLFEKVIRQH